MIEGAGKATSDMLNQWIDEFVWICAGKQELCSDVLGFYMVLLLMDRI